MKRHINKNFKHLVRTYEGNRQTQFKDTKIAILEGASRSGKTISAVDFLIWTCLSYENKIIFLIRSTYNSHKTTLYTDFDKRLKAFGLNSPFDTAKEVSQFSIGNNKLFFVGADTPGKFEGAGCDIAYFNEILDIQQPVFDQIEQRCREFVFGDYNPKFTAHWVYKSILNRPDCNYLHTTFKDNPFISAQELKKILSYEPTPANIEAGTADDYRWKVYGLGQRAAQQGLIFPNVAWVVDDLPQADYYNYGLDFGFTNDPTCLVKACIIGNNLYAKKLIYQPIDNSNDLGECMTKIGIKRTDIIIADSADVGGNSVEGFVSDLRQMGFTIIKAQKKTGSIIEGITKLKNYKLNLVLDTDVKNEQENYQWKEINGIQINQPIDAFNHFWDALRYLIQSYVQPMKAY